MYGFGVFHVLSEQLSTINMHLLINLYSKPVKKITALNLRDKSSLKDICDLSWTVCAHALLSSYRFSAC